MNGVTTIVALVDLLSNGITDLFTGCKLQLFTGPFVPNPDMVPGDIVVPTFTGYIDKATTLGVVAYDGSVGSAVVNGTATYSWFGPNDMTGQNITGWALVQPGAAGPPLVPNEVLAAGQFPAPISLAVPTDHIAMAVTVEGNGVVSVTLLP